MISTMMTQKNGILVLVSAPSGGGKNVVIRQLMARYPGSVQLVTTTTRPMRDGEKHGVDYYFISKEDFQYKLAAGGFVEHNEYNGNYYGTERGESATPPHCHTAADRCSQPTRGESPHDFPPVTPAGACT